MRKLNEYTRQQLTSVYSVERQDDQQSVIIMLAILTVGITYIIAGTAFFLSHYQNGKVIGVPEFVQITAPVITIGLFGFFVINNAATWVRARLLLRLEHLLALNPDEASPGKLGINLPSFRTSSSFIFEPKPRGIEAIFFITLIANYGVCSMVAFGFTAFCLALGPWDGWKSVALALYAIIYAVEVTGLLLPQFSSRFK